MFTIYLHSYPFAMCKGLDEAIHLLMALELEHGPQAVQLLRY